MSPRSGAERGYALIIMMVLLVVGSLYAVVNQFNKATLQGERVADTNRALQMAKAALLGYAATYPDDPDHADATYGLLPCPDMDGDGVADPISTCQTTKDQTVIGLLPYRTLGLADLRDSEGQCLWYAVSGHFKASGNNKTDSLNWDTQGQLAVVDAQGASLTQPEDAQGGAAAIIFAVHAPLSGQTRTRTAGLVCDYNPNPNSGTFVHTHFIDSDPTPGATPSTKAANAITTFRMGSPGSNSNNDAMAWVSPREVFTAAKSRNGTGSKELGSKLKTLSDEIAKALTQGTSLPTPLAPTTTPNNVLIYGTLPDLTPNPLPGDAGNDFPHWRNQYRYAKCVSNNQCINPTTPTPCSGVLLFAGERSTRGPRTAAERGDMNSYIENLPSKPNLTSLLTGGNTFSSTHANTGHSRGGSTLIASALALPAPTLAAAGDDVICLNPVPSTPPPPLNVTGVGGFSPPTGSGLSITNTPTISQITLGLLSGTTVYGCSWFPEIIEFDKGLRVYFVFNRRTDTGDGFTFALADATTNSSINMCGNTGDSLGYSGNNGITAPINAPKLALEFDTDRDTNRADPSDSHAAFVFWAGSSRNQDVDNKHGAYATDVTPNVRYNPTESDPGPGLNQSTAELTDGQAGKTRPQGDIYVRFDVVPVANSAPRRYTLTAYLTDKSDIRDKCQLTNLDIDIAGMYNTGDCSTPPSLKYTHPTPMTRAYMGFTMGQAAGNGSQIIIDNFRAKGR